MVATVETEFGRELTGLRILTEETRGGVLAFSLYSDVRTRDAASEWFKSKSSMPVEIVPLSSGIIDLAEIIGRFPAPSRHCFLFVDIEAAFPKLLGYVNLNRERLFRFGHALVFWIREEGLRRIAESAPDFWSWRTNVFDFRTAQPLSLAPSGWHDAVIGHYHKSQLLEQVRGLEEWLEESGESDFVTQLALGRRLLALGRFEEADKALQRAVAEAERQNDVSGLAETLLLLANSKVNQARFDEGMQLYSRSYEVAKQMGPNDSSTAALLQSSSLSQLIGNSDLDLNLAATMKEVAGTLRDPTALASAHEQLGNVLFAGKDVRGAELEYLAAATYEEQLSHRVDLARTLARLSRVYQEMGAASKALCAVDRAVALLQESGWDPTDIAGIMQSSGVEYPLNNV